MTPDEETLLEDTRVALCRCGLSANKPLCDNSHQDEFRAVGSAGQNSTETEEQLIADSLNVTPIPDGPLALRGEFELRGEEDDSPSRTTKPHYVAAVARRTNRSVTALTRRSAFRASRQTVSVFTRAVGFIV